LAAHLNLRRASCIALLLALAAILVESLDRPSAFITQGEEAPDFTLVSIYNESITLSNYRGSVVLLDFWASWCEPCKEEIRELSKLYSKYRGDGLVIISINIREILPSVRAFAENNGMDWIVVLDKDGSIAVGYGVMVIPTLILINKDGTIAYMNAGFVGEGDLVREIDEALGRSSTRSIDPIFLAGAATLLGTTIILTWARMKGILKQRKIVVTPLMR